MSLNSVRDGGDVSHEPRNNGVCSGLNALGAVARSALSRLVGRGGAVRSTGDHWKSVALDWERGRSCASGLCRSAWKRFSRRPSSSRSLNFTAAPSRSLLMLTNVDQRAKTKLPREVPSITQSYVQPNCISPLSAANLQKEHKTCNVWNNIHNVCKWEHLL